MGRTWPTFNDQLENEMNSWRPFRQALRKEDQRAFDKLFALAKRHMAAGQNAARPIPFETVMLCVALELIKALDRREAESESEHETR